jgi:hypothetical protein
MKKDYDIVITEVFCGTIWETEMVKSHQDMSDLLWVPTISTNQKAGNVPHRHREMPGMLMS